MRYRDKWPLLKTQWDTMKVGYRKGVPSQQAVDDLKGAADFAIANKARYLATAGRVRAHWAHIAVIHKRESDPDHNGNPRFDTYLGNGQTIHRVTTIVPKGRGPWATFEDGAVDAWHLDGLDSILDWRLEKMLYWCIILNGIGYEPKPSPYVWALSSIQVRGKFTSDGRKNNRVWDTQVGCAPMLYVIAQRDSSVEYVRET